MPELSMPVSGFRDDAKFRAFFDSRPGAPPPTPAEYPAIARWSLGLPGRLDALVALRADLPGYAEAMRLSPSAPGPAPDLP